MVAYRDYQFPRDRAAVAKVEREIEEVLRKANSPELAPWVERTDYFYKVFKNKDAERLRIEFMRLNVFQESWIPTLKSGSYKRFQLFDLAADSSQTVDVSKQHPEVFSRLKRQLLEINASVMAEAPDWGSADEAPTPSNPNPGTSKKLNRPNVVVLLADDLGWKDIGCYGGPVATPTLDKLAAEGVRFTDFHAGAAICSPSRATLLTGRQHLRTGIYGVLQDHLHNAHLLKREVTIAEVLQQVGYETAHFGKWHIGMTSGKRRKPTLKEHGFDYWFGLSNGASPSHKNPVNFQRNGKPVGPLRGYSCQLVVDDAIRWLNERNQPDQPFFLNIWFNEPHAKLAAPDEIVSVYGDLKDEAAIYSATIDNTDRAIGRLVAKLKETGRLDNTLIVYSSDNGSYRADRNGGLHGNKGSNFEGGLRSPGVFFWPRGIRGGRVENTPAGSVDLLPTICGLAGIEKPPGVHLDGADLSPLLTEQGQFQRMQPMFWLTPTSGHLGTLRDGRYTLMGYRGYDLPEEHATRDKLLRQMARLAGIDEDAENLRSRIANTTFTSPEFRRLRGKYVKLTTFQESWIPIIKSGGFSRFALYDLASDPTQTKDVSRQQAEVTARLKKKLLTLYKSVMADAPDWSAQQPSRPD